MRWTVAVPLKPAGARKSRLAPTLDPAAREALAERMARHVLGVVDAFPGATPMLLSSARPDWWTGAWRQDEASGLNAAIENAREPPFAVVHADLPLLAADDLAALFAAAEASGPAIAPDRHGTGTNAIAIADDRPFVFAFGPDSFARHRAQGGTIVQRPGLAFDVDTAADLAAIDVWRAR